MGGVYRIQTFLGLFFFFIFTRPLDGLVQILPKAQKLAHMSPIQAFKNCAATFYELQN